MMYVLCPILLVCMILLYPSYILATFYLHMHSDSQLIFHAPIFSIMVTVTALWYRSPITLLSPAMGLIYSSWPNLLIQLVFLFKAQCIISQLMSIGSPSICFFKLNLDFYPDPNLGHL